MKLYTVKALQILRWDTVFNTPVCHSIPISQKFPLIQIFIIDHHYDIIVYYSHCRYIAVCHPLQCARLCTESRAKLIVVMITCACMLTQSFRLFYISRLNRENRQPCHAPKEIRMEYFGWHTFW